LQALAVTGFGGLMLLGAAIVFGHLGGTYSIQELLNSGINFTESSMYVLLLVFVFGAAFTKSAQFPFHFWLPGAMKAPTPVSTYLHSATMVKAGIYLLLRFTPVLGNHEYWNTTLFTVGAVTMLYAAFHTLFRTDLKSILAYSTISVLGILVFLIGLGSSLALHAALVFIVVHALYKAALFLITGIIDHETGTRDVTKLAGLKTVLLPVAIAGFLAMFSNAGMIPSFGFIG
jgi:multicomponent Na+:H+ antiporter subunit A